MSLCSFLGLEFDSKSIKSIEMSTYGRSHNIIISEYIGIDEREHVLRFDDIGVRDINFLLLAKLLGREVVH